MRRLTLREYETTQAVALSPIERDWLSTAIPSVTVGACPGRSGHYELTPGSWLGGALCDSLAVSILPKIPVERLLFMLSYSLYRRSWRTSPFVAEAHEGIVEAIVASFIMQVRRTLAFGVLRGYQPRKDDLHTIRGRIRFDDQLRTHFGQFPPIAVEYDEFNEDIDENRLILTAAHRLGQLRLRSDRLRRGLLEIDHALSGATLVSYNPSKLPTVHYNRLNEHYRPAIELAKLILRSMSFESRHGALPTTALLFDMNKVFEDFVVLALRDELRLSSTEFPREAKGKSLWLDRERNVKLYPDISWWNGTTCTFVGDVKYKRTIGAHALNSDIYQVLAYSVAADLPGGMLIYAAGEEAPASMAIVHVNKMLHVRTLDLNTPPEGILAQISGIARHIRSQHDWNLHASPADGATKSLRPFSSAGH
jgi:5-methylcytosine-specific restriction enzyme subunit McrC